jgi:hypothetical protein
VDDVTSFVNAPRGRATTMSNIIRSGAHGLLAAGVLLIVVYFLGVSLKGPDAIRDALDPLALRTYLAVLPLLPGALLLWLADYLASHRRYGNRWR